MLRRNETIRVARRPKKHKVVHYEDEDSPAESPSVSRQDSELSSHQDSELSSLQSSGLSSCASSVSSSPAGSVRSHKPPSTLELTSSLTADLDNNNTTEDKKSHQTLCCEYSLSSATHIVYIMICVSIPFSKVCIINMVCLLLAMLRN